MDDNRRQPVNPGLPTGVILALQRLFGPRWREKASELLDAEAARLAKPRDKAGKALRGLPGARMAPTARSGLGGCLPA